MTLLASIKWDIKEDIPEVSDEVIFTKDISLLFDDLDIIELKCDEKGITTNDVLLCIKNRI